MYLILLKKGVIVMLDNMQLYHRFRICVNIVLWYVPH